MITTAHCQDCGALFEHGVAGVDTPYRPQLRCVQCEGDAEVVFFGPFLPPHLGRSRARLSLKDTQFDEEAVA
jgi:hypothetical protein